MHAIVSDLRSLWKARGLLWVMIRREMLGRYAGTAGGIVWAFVQPLLMVAAYYLVFDVVFAMRLGENAPTRAVGIYLIAGMLPWMAFSEAISRGMNSLIEAGSVLQKNALPPVLFVARSVLATAVVHIPLLILLALVYAPLHGGQSGILAIVPLLALQWTLCLLLGYILAIFAAALRDTVQIIGFTLSVGIFLSPVLFPLDMFPEAWRWVLWLNPMTGLITGFQTVLLTGAWPAFDTWVATLAWCALCFGMLCLLLKRCREQLVDWL